MGCGGKARPVPGAGVSEAGTLQLHRSWCWRLSIRRLDSVNMGRPSLPSRCDLYPDWGGGTLARYKWPTASPGQ